MEIIGLIAEYSPFHNGHDYQIKKIKEKYPDSLIIVILNGYFLERGLVSIESKEEKTRLALKYGADLVIELPFFFGSNSADVFAEAAVELLNELKCERLIFGSESDNIAKLKKAARKQLNADFDILVKKYMSEGINYPTALNKALDMDIREPNDLLGVSYIKAIFKNDYKITAETIKRTNDFHDIKSNKKIISASNIRERIKNNMDISAYIPEGKILKIDESRLFLLLKYKILTDNDLSSYLSVDEGIEKRLYKAALASNSVDDLINNTKTKRYTYNRLMRMFVHILIGFKKSDRDKINNNQYIRILGLRSTGQKYINKIKKDVNLPITSKLTNINSLIKDYELASANIYKLLTDDDVLKFEFSNKPLIFNEETD